MGEDENLEALVLLRWLARKGLVPLAEELFPDVQGFTIRAEKIDKGWRLTLKVDGDDPLEDYLRKEAGDGPWHN